MTICHNRLLLRVIHFAYPPYRRRIRSASHCRRGFRREFFQAGRRSEVCVWSFNCCGIIVTTLQWTIMGSTGVGGAHIVLCYSCCYLNPAGRNLSCRTMLRCLGVIWAEIGHWLGWPIVSIGPGCLMMLTNGSASVSCASRGSHRLDGIIRWEIFRPVISGIDLGRL